MDFITEATLKAVKRLYNTDIAAGDISLQETRKEFEGQVTIVTFPFTKFSKKSPEQTGNEIGAYLQGEIKQIAGFNVIKGFLNISLSDNHWINMLFAEILRDDFAVFKPNGEKVMVEYSSPNTNKPLHLGHVRNNLLGFSVAEILTAAGYEVTKTNLVNDRGIHICKSMLAWQKWGNGETPESSGLKGDHLVGKYYVIFEKHQKVEIQQLLDQVYCKKPIECNKADNELISVKLAYTENLKDLIKQSCNLVSPGDIAFLGERFEIIFESVADGNLNSDGLLKRFKEEYSPKDKNDLEIKINYIKDLFETRADLEKHLKQVEEEIKDVIQRNTPLMKQTQEMLQKWEAGDKDVKSLWKTMNSWVYRGFAETYKKLGVSFDKFYYESDTYILGKDIIEEGLQKSVFFRKADNSVWIDLTDEGLDEKLLLRSDGTSVYMTQDLGTAQLKYNDFHMDKSIYVVGNEQDYHFKVLFTILKKLGKKGADGLFHLSYGMVDLPSGKMKSREGTVVDADDLIDEMEQTAKEQTEAMGKVKDFGGEEKQHLYHIIGMGALKYFLLKVDPKKRLLFDPNESVDFQGHTGPFIQYTHARIRSVLNKADTFDIGGAKEYNQLAAEERDLIASLSKFPEIIKTAADTYSPSVVANYMYELAKTYNKFYHEKSILQAENEAAKKFRLFLSTASGKVINKGMGLLGIDVPERM
ncbi:MAG TPA: arginine--tRNA ligase [Mucilaginibacter sp.]|jgi:arginyl-tRNA synthetase